MRTNDIPREITDAMEETGLPWSIVMGKRHRKLMLGGRLVTVIPTYFSKHSVAGGNTRAHKNVLANIRRAADRFKQELVT